MGAARRGEVISRAGAVREQVGKPERRRDVQSLRHLVTVDGAAETHDSVNYLARSSLEERTRIEKRGPLLAVLCLLTSGRRTLLDFPVRGPKTRFMVGVKGAASWQLCSTGVLSAPPTFNVAADV